MGIIATEALVQLWFYAGPLQPIRGFLIRVTPFLVSDDTHLLNCKYCVSLWVGLLLATILWLAPGVFMFCAVVLSFHRVANFLHLAFSYLRDKQLDLRIARK